MTPSAQRAGLTVKGKDMDYRDANCIERDRVAHYSRSFGGLTSTLRRTIRQNPDVPTFNAYYAALPAIAKKRHMRDIRAEYNRKFRSS